MKLSDKEICNALADAYLDPTAQISMFTSGAKFARDYYEKQIARLIESVNEAIDQAFTITKIGDHSIETSTLRKRSDCLKEIGAILREFEAKDGSNP